MKSFSEKERGCEMTFQNLQSYWHSYTNGKETPVLFATEEDMSFVMNVIAQAAFLLIDKVRIIAFTVMNNHLHFILSGSPDSIEEMLRFISRRLIRAFPFSATLNVSHKPINDLGGDGKVYRPDDINWNRK